MYDVLFPRIIIINFKLHSLVETGILKFPSLNDAQASFLTDTGENHLSLISDATL